MTLALRALLPVVLLAVANDAVAASFCELDGAEVRIEAVDKRTAVFAIEVRNVGPVEADLDGVEIVVTGQADLPLVDRVRLREPVLRRLAFPPGVRLAVGQIVSVGLQGSYEFKRQFGDYPDFELPYRGGEPQVPDMRVPAGAQHMGAQPALVGLICPSRGIDLDVMNLTEGPGRVQAPRWVPPEIPDEVDPGSGLEGPQTDPVTPGPRPRPAPGSPQPTGPVAVEPTWAISSSGYGGYFTRVFTPDDNDATNEVSTGPEVQARLEIESDSVDVTVQAFALADIQSGAERGLFTLQDAYVGVQKGRLRLRVGFQSLAWGALEVFQPVDTVNARFFDGSLPDPPPLGEPMAQGRVLLAGFAVIGFVMPSYTGSVFPSASSRRSFYPGVAIGDPIWVDIDGEVSSDSFGLQGGLEVSRPLGPVDVSAHIVRQVDRTQPLFVVDLLGGGVRPLYLPVLQAGGTARGAFGPVVLKLEGARRAFTYPERNVAWGALPNQDHTALAAGFDVSYNVGRATHAALAEAQTLLGPDPDRLAAMGPFQRDALVGYRVDLNDTQSRTALAGLMVDLERPDRMYFIATYTQRLFGVLTLDLEALYVNAPPGDTLEPAQLERLHQDVQLEVMVSRYF